MSPALATAINRARFQHFITPSDAVPDAGIDLTRKQEDAPHIEVAKPLVYSPLKRELSDIEATIVWHHAHIELLQDEYAKLVGQIHVRKPRIEDIQRAVANHYKIGRNEINSLRRDAFVVRVRHVAIYLAKTLTTLSLPALGRMFGNRDHTTVLHAVRKIEKLRAEDPLMDAELKMFEAQFAPR